MCYYNSQSRKGRNCILECVQNPYFAQVFVKFIYDFGFSYNNQTVFLSK